MQPWTADVFAVCSRQPALSLAMQADCRPIEGEKRTIGWLKANGGDAKLWASSSGP